MRFGEVRPQPHRLLVTANGLVELSLAGQPAPQIVVRFRKLGPMAQRLPQADSGLLQIALLQPWLLLFARS